MNRRRDVIFIISIQNKEGLICNCPDSIIDQEYALLIKGSLNETRRNKFLETLREILGNSAQIKIKEINKIMTLGGKVRNIVNFHKH